jgi:diguanylate cyclase (GGDEF)-like protein
VTEVDRQLVFQKWQEACVQADISTADSWPQGEARALVDELATSADSRLSGEPARAADSQWVALTVASRAWAHKLPALSVMNRQISTLRQILADQPVDKVTGSALTASLDEALLVATEELAAQLEGAAMHDPLTGAGNRRALGVIASAALERAAKSGDPVCVVVVDLDGLKKINDANGHDAGDYAIVQLVAGLNAVTRGSDQVFRTGGDEFAVLLPGSAASAALDLVGRLADFQMPTFTWGAADTTEGLRTLDDLVRAADHRLYEKRRAMRSGTAIAARASQGVFADLPPGAEISRRERLKTAAARKQAIHSAVSGALILAIGSVFVAITSSTHQVCALGDGSGVANCGLSNATYYAAIVLIGVGGALLALGLFVRVLAGRLPS